VQVKPILYKLQKDMVKKKGVFSARVRETPGGLGV
jgi:hypothetical protein